MSNNSPVVIYEVNLAVDVEVVERFDEWLHHHSEEMLAIPGFISASTSVPDVEDEFVKHRCVQYRLSDQAAYQSYLDNHAERMRAKLHEHFEGHFTAQRRVLSVAEAALAKHGVCANCDAELSGRFCNVCGQREEPRVPTIGALVGEFTNEMFGVESKVWRSFATLFLRPGELTRVYLAGRRQKYMSPVRLYLLFSILAFAVITLINSADGIAIIQEPTPVVEEPSANEEPSADREPSANEEPSADQEPSADRAKKLEQTIEEFAENLDQKLEQNGGDFEASIKELAEQIKAEAELERERRQANGLPPIPEPQFNSDLFSPETNSVIQQRLRHAFKSIREEINAGNQRAVVSKFIEPLPTALLIFLPIVAFVFKILFLGSGKYYVEHLIFVLHNHAFLFAIFIFSTLASQSVQSYPEQEPFIASGILLIIVLACYTRLRDFIARKSAESKVKGGLYLIGLVGVLALLFDSTSTDGLSALSSLMWVFYIPYYLYRSLRVVYQRPRWGTALTLMVTSVIYMVMLFAMILSSAVFVGISFSA